MKEEADLKAKVAAANKRAQDERNKLREEGKLLPQDTLTPNPVQQGNKPKERKKK